MIRKATPKEAAEAFFAGKKVRRDGVSKWFWLGENATVNNRNEDGEWTEHIAVFNLSKIYDVLEQLEVGDTFRIVSLGIDREDSLRTIVYVDDDCVGYKQPDGKECGMVSLEVFDSWLETRQVADYTKRGQQ